MNSSLQEIFESYVNFDFSNISLDHVLNAINEAGNNVHVWKHPLGFYHAELTQLIKLPANERFRLHFWLDQCGVSDGLGSLHEHTWDLTSLVLEGIVIDSNLRTLASSEGEYLGSRISYGTENKAIEAGRFDLEITNTRVLKKGMFYQIPSRVVHLNEVGQVPTVTLVRSIADNLPMGPLVLAKVNHGQGTVTATRKRVSTLAMLKQLKSCTVTND